MNLCKVRVVGSIPTVSIIKKVGGLAQLGERLHGMQEVVGSNPSVSIIIPE